MKQRLSTWLLALVLAGTGAFSATAALIVGLREESRIVCLSPAERVEREVAEPRTLAVVFARETVSTATESDAPQVSTSLDRARFQRPPPSFRRS